MRIGVSLTSRHDVSDVRQGARWMIERAAAAADAGLDHLTIGDHHAEPVPYFQNVPMLGRMLAEWDDRPAGCLFLVPLWHPVLMAEQIGTLAALHPGRFIVQTGLGHGHKQFAAMGGDHRTRPSDFSEGVRIVQGLLDGATISSERFGLTDAQIAPRPPEPVEWWIGASADAALERAAGLSGIWYASPGLTLDTARDRLDVYLAALGRHGRDPERLVLRRDVLVAPTDDEAQRLAQDVVAAGYRGMALEQLVVGSPESAAEQFAAFGELGFTDISVRQISVGQDDALRSLALLGDVHRMLR